MDVRFSEEQELLRKSARDFLARECAMPQVRAWMEDPHGFSETVWSQMVELGWVGLALPEAHGGAGLGAVELAIVLEEIGRAAAPCPFLSSAVLGAGAIALAGDGAQHARWLPALAGGARRATLAWLDDGAAWDPESVSLTVESDADGLRLTGRKRLVPDAHAADWLLVAARGADGVALYHVPADARGVTVRPTLHVDQTRRVCELTLDGVRVDADARLARSAEALGAVLDLARIAVCADLCGVAGAALELAVAFAGSREQFGRPIGSFQAIQHRCADMLVRVESARSATYRAAWLFAAGDAEAHVAACMAKGYCSDAAARVAGDCIQIHGGLGFTWEQDPQVYYKRAKAGELLLGDGPWHREQVANALWGRPGAAAR